MVSPTGQPSSLIICEGDSTFSLLIANTSGNTISGSNLTLELPDNCLYIPGTSGNATEIDISNLNSPVFSLPDIINNTSLNVSYNAEVVCGYDNTQDFTYIVTHNSNTYSGYDTPLQNYYYPSVVITNISNNSVTIHVNQTITRDFTIEQQGLYGALDTLIVVDEHTADIEVLSVSIGTLNIDNGPGPIYYDTIIITGSDMPGGNNLFDYGETIILSEEVKLRGCNNGQSTINATWGCYDEYCESFLAFPSVNPSSGVPLIDMDFTGNNMGWGFVENSGYLEFSVTNNGSGAGTAYDLVTLAGFSSSSSLYYPNNNWLNEIDSFSVNGNYLKSFYNYASGAVNGQYAYYFRYSFADDPDGPGQGIEDVDGDGFYDDLPVGHTIIVKAHTYYNWLEAEMNIQTGNNCGRGWTNNAWQAFRFGYDLTDQCSSQNGVTWVPNSNMLMFMTYNTNTLEHTIPADIYDGTTVWMQQHVSTSTRVDNEGCSNDSVIYSLELPQGIVIAGGTPTFKGVSMGAPEITGNVAIFSLSKDRVKSGGWFKVPLQLDCNVPHNPTGTINTKLRFWCDNILFPSRFFTYWCSTSPVFGIQCPLTTCQDPYISGFNVERNTFGWIDNQLSKKVNRNTSGILLNKAMALDSIKITTKAVLNNTYDSLFFELQHDNLPGDWSNNLFFNILTDTLHFFDFETDNWYECFDLSPEVITGSVSAINVNLSSLTEPGGCLNGLSFTTGDSLIYIVHGQVKNVAQTGWNTVSGLRARYYNIESNNEKYCNDLGTTFNVLGSNYPFYRNTFINPTVVEGCDDLLFYGQIYRWLDVCNNDISFPNEVRPYVVLDTITFSLPEGYYYQPGTAVHRYRNIDGTLTSEPVSDPVIEYSNNQVNLMFIRDDDWSYSGYIDCSRNQDRIDFYATASCQTESVISSQATMKGRYQFYTDGIGISHSSSSNSNKQYTGSEIVLTPLITTAEGRYDTVFWELRLCNVTNIDAENNWLAFESASNGIEIIELIDITNPSNEISIPVNGYNQGKKWALLDTISSNGCSIYKVKAVYTSCSTDSLFVRQAFNCVGYPVDPDLGYSPTAFSCNENSTMLYLEPNDVNLNLQVTSPSNPLSLCDTLDYEIEVTNTLLSYAYNLSVNIDVPPGITFIPSASEVSFPFTSGTYTSVNDPVNQPAGSNSWVYDISSDPGGIDLLKGIDSIPNNGYKLRFKIITDCNLISGSSLRITASASNSCGAVKTRISSTSPVIIGGLPTNVNLYVISTENEHVIPTCDTSFFIKSKVINLGPNSASSIELLSVSIDDAYDYVPGSLISVHNGPSGISNNIVIDGIRYIQFAIQPNLNINDSIVFYYELIDIDPGSLTCDTIDLTTNAMLVASVPCPSIPAGSCEIQSITSSLVTELIIQKDDVRFGSYIAMSKPEGIDSELVTIDYSVINFGNQQFNSDSLDIIFFNDSNDNGIPDEGVSDSLYFQRINVENLSGGDSVISKAEFIVNGDKICNLTASIRLSEDTCICSETVMEISDIRLINSGNDTSVCVNQDLQIGSESLLYYDYRWIPSAYLSSSLISNPDFNYTGSATEPDTLLYTLVTTRPGGCISQDTTVIIVYPHASSSAGSDERICESMLFNFLTSSTLPVATNYDSLFWSGGSGVFINPDSIYPIYIPGNNEFGEVELYLTAISHLNCSHDVSSMKLTIDSLPSPSMSVYPEDSICVFESVLFSGYNLNNTTVVDWFWNFGDGNAATGNNTTHFYDNSGVYPITLIATTSFGCIDSIQSSISVNELPEAGFQIIPGDTICTGIQVDLIANSTTNIINWNWDFGDNTTAGGQNTSHVYSTSGNYFIELVVENENSCLDTVIDSIYVRELPVAELNYIPADTSCLNDTVYFNGISSNNIISWMWYFGDGNVSQGQHVNHIYTADGMYNISLVIIDEYGCKDSIHDSIFIRQQVLADFLISPSDTSCIDESISFSGFGDNDIINWNWDFGDGNTATGQIVDHTFNSPGIFDITLVYSNIFGCIDTIIHQKTIDNPNISFNISPAPNCLGDSIYVTSTGNNVTYADYYWNFGDGIGVDSGYNSSYYYSHSGVYNIALEVCSQNADRLHTVNPVCVVNSGGDQVTCQDVYFNYSNSITPPTAEGQDSIVWRTTGLGYFDDSTLVAPTYFPHPSEGSVQNDTIIMTMIGYAKYPCDNDTSFMSLVIIPGAYAQAGSDENSCIGQPFDFANSTDSAFATNYATLQWFTSGTGYFIDPNVQQPVYIPGTGELGDVTLTMIATNIINCDSVDDMILTIHPVYEVPVDITVCYYDSVFLEGRWQLESGVFYDTLSSQSNCDSVIITNLTVRQKIDKQFDIDRGDSVCMGEIVTFIPTGSANLSNWYWDFGDGNYSSGYSPEHQYYNPGSYIVIYYYTDINGCTDSTISEVTVFEIPDVDFDINMDNACIDFPVEFNGISSSDIILWYWDFGDGTTGLGQNISHTYSEKGNMIITLTVTDAIGCQKEVTKELLVLQSSNADFISENLSCDSVQFTDLSTTPEGYNIVQWYWDFGDGDTSDLQNPVHVYPPNTNPGGVVYNVELIITSDSNGFLCSNAVIYDVLIPSDPDIFFTWNPEPTCLGLQTHFYGNSGFPISHWHWDFDDGNFSNLQNPVHIYTGPGQYNVTLSITDLNGCNNSLTNVIQVVPVPYVDFIMSDSVSCSSGLIYFTSFAGNNVASWYWDFGDGSFSNEENPVHNFYVPDIYTVSLTVIDSSGCENVKSQEINILPVPAADFSYTNINCNAFLFIDQSTPPEGYNIVDWFWDFGDGYTSSLQNPSHDYGGGPDIYEVILIVVSDSGGFYCSDTVSQTIVTNSMPSVFFTWNPEPTMLGDQTEFFGTSGNTVVNWYWDFGDGNFDTSQNTENTYSEAGIYDVSLTITDDLGCNNTVVNQVTVSVPPELDFSWNNSCVNSPVIFIIESPPTDISSVIIWDWEFGDGGQSGQMEPQHVYSTAGTYNVRLTIVDNQNATATLEKQIVIHPNPQALFNILPPYCADNEVQFIDYSTSGSGNIFKWEWDFGDGTSETVLYPDSPDITHMYSEPGNYDVSLTVENTDSCSGLYQNTVSVLPPPTADFSFNISCAGTPINFIDNSLENGGGDIINYLWLFGDPGSGSANMSNMQNPVHIYNTPGDYEVTQIVTNINDCVDSMVSIITISDQPSVSFSYSDVCFGSETEFSSEVGTGVLSYNWSFGDGEFSDLQHPTHLYQYPGDYLVTLSIVTDDSCFADTSSVVIINPLPIPDFTNQNPACLNEEVEFTDLSISPNGLIDTWEWDFGDGVTSTVVYPDPPDQYHNYTQSGNYMVSLTVTDQVGCVNMLTNQVQIIDPPIADFSFVETCYNNPVQFTDLSSTSGGMDIQNWEWYFGDPGSGNQNSSYLQNPSHIYSSPDTYNAQLIVISLAGCSDTVENEVIVDPLPDVSISVNSDSICQGALSEFAGIGTNISTWFWEFGDGGSSIEQNPVYLYSNPGIYTVVLTVTGSDSDGCSNSATKTMVVTGKPEANFEFDRTCLGDSTLFTDLSFSQYALISQWEWDFGDGGSSTMKDPVHVYQNNTDYQVTLIITDDFGCSDTMTKQLHIFAPPIPGFSYNQLCEPTGLVSFFDESEIGIDGSPISEWNWDFSDGNYSTEIDPEYIFPVTDSCYIISLQVTDINGCSASDTNTEVCLFGELKVDFTSTTECFGQNTFFETWYQPDSDSILTYIWSFNDGSDTLITTLDTINHIFSHPGNFIVGLTAVDTFGCSNMVFREVKVDSLPVPMFTNSSTSCSNPMYFTDITKNGGSDIVSWQWSFGDTISNQDNYSSVKNPEHIYGLFDSTYHVKLIILNQNGCIDSTVQDVFVEPCLIADFSLIDFSCAGFNVYPEDNSKLFSNNSIIENWYWDFGDGNYYNYDYKIDSFPHKYENEGNYNVQLIISTELSGILYSDTMNQSIIVQPRPFVDFEFENTCIGDTTNFFGTTDSNGQLITSWQWDFGDSTFVNADTTLQNPIYYYPEPGVYNTLLKIVNDQGCCNIVFKDIKINNLPIAGFSYEESCMGYYTFFENRSYSDSSEISAYNWDFGDVNNTDNFSTVQNPVYIYDSSGIYDVKLVIEDDNLCIDSISHELEVFPVPKSDFMIIDTNQQGQVYLSNMTEGATNYQWFFNYNYNLGETSVETNPFFQYKEDGSYRITLVSTNEFGCPDTSYQVYNVIFKNLFVPNAFVPSGTIPELQTFKPVGINLKKYRLQVYSAWGNLVFESTKLNNGSPAEGWNGRYIGEDLPSGSYMWKIHAVFNDGTTWEGSDNGDGNVGTSGTVMLIR